MILLEKLHKVSRGLKFILTFNSFNCLFYFSLSVWSWKKRWHFVFFRIYLTKKKLASVWGPSAIIVYLILNYDFRISTPIYLSRYFMFCLGTWNYKNKNVNYFLSILDYGTYEVSGILYFALHYRIDSS